GFRLRGVFQPGAGPAPDPAASAVTLTVGPFSQMLPAGSFIASVKSTKTTWSFKAARGSGGLTKVTITRPADGDWTFKAQASGTSLAGAANPIVIGLRIGGDPGALPLFFTARDSASRRVFKYPGSKNDDADGDGQTSRAGDCDDQDPAVHTGAPERCNGVDDDCDGDADEGFDLGAACTVGSGSCQRSGV